LSYTRAQRINYHATGAASTAMRGSAPQNRFCPAGLFRAGGALNRRRFVAYTEISINNERR